MARRMLVCGLAALVAPVVALRGPLRAGAAAAVPAALGPAEPQVLRFRDAATDVNVVLIGTMHYNPVSISTVEKLIARHKRDESLRAVVIESCPARWNISATEPPRATVPLSRKLFYNEMLAAADAAAPGVPLILGDARIEDIGIRVRELAFATLKQVGDFPGGWIRNYQEFRSAFQRAVFQDGQGVREGRRLGVGDFLHFPLLFGAPISIFRYCTAILLRGPDALRVPLVLMLAILASHPEASASEGLAEGAALLGGVDVDPQSWLQTAGDLASSSAFAAAETLLLGRIFLVGLLEERNVVLARNIRLACTQAKMRHYWGNLFGRRGPERATIIAVLGMAHCNGVQQILQTDDKFEYLGAEEGFGGCQK